MGREKAQIKKRHETFEKKRYGNKKTYTDIPLKHASIER